MVDELVQGRGAWTTHGKDNGSIYYCFVSRDTRDGANGCLDLDHFAVHHGVRAIQVWLNTSGFTYLGLKIPVDGRFGRITRRGVKWFQTTNGLASDGVFGPSTARTLWRPLVTKVAAENLVPASILWGMTALESAFDPGAVSARYKIENGPDLGLCQINHHFNPDISPIESFKPRLALTWSAGNLRDAMDEFSGKGVTLQINCAVAHHNNPTQARTWFRTGQPPTEQIAEYVDLVGEAAATYSG